MENVSPNYVQIKLMVYTVRPYPPKTIVACSPPSPIITLAIMESQKLQYFFYIVIFFWMRYSLNVNVNEKVLSFNSVINLRTFLWFLGFSVYCVIITHSNQLWYLHLRHSLFVFLNFLNSSNCFDRARLHEIFSSFLFYFFSLIALPKKAIVKRFSI